MVTKEIMDYFKFDEVDLAANKTGAMTDKQKANLQESIKSSRGVGIVFGIILLGAAAIFPIAFFGNCLFGGNCKTDPGIGGIIGGLVLVVVNLIWVGIWGGIGVALIKGSVTKHGYKLKLVEGPVNIVERTSTDSEHHTTHHYELHVSGQEFDVDSELSDIMMQGDFYAFYYLVESDNEDTPYQILSAERLTANS